MSKIDRRQLLAAAPAAGFAALVAGAGPAEADAGDWQDVLRAARHVDSPVRCAYREWRSYHDWAVSPAVNSFSEEEMETVTDQMTAHVDRIIATPSSGLMDTLLKLVAAIEDYQLFSGIEALESLEAEARALVGA